MNHVVPDRLLVDRKRLVVQALSVAEELNLALVDCDLSAPDVAQGFLQPNVLWNTNSMVLLSVTGPEVESLLKNLNDYKATDHKNCAEELAGVLAFYINKSLEGGVYPFIDF